MGLEGRFTSKIIGLDTSPIIYYIEEIEPFYQKMNHFFEDHSKRDFQIVLPVLCLTEVLVHPLRKRDEKLISEYKTIFSKTENISLIHINNEIALKAAELRAKYTGLKTPDALQIATALSSQCDYLLTNDIALKKVQEIEVITIQDLPS